MIRAVLLALGLWPTGIPPVEHVQVALATHFDVPARDPWNPVGLLACRRAGHRARELRRTDLLIAHRTLPCWSRVLLYSPRTGRSVVARVGDRGPYGKNAHGLDLAPAVSRALRTNGMEHVLVVAFGGRP